jgi:hypothetical protein
LPLLHQDFLCALLFDLKQQFVGRIDFYQGVTLPVSYLWHPTSTTDPNQIYIVLAMQQDVLDPIIDLLQYQGSYGLELWPSGPLFGAYTNGYAGKLKSLNEGPRRSARSLVADYSSFSRLLNVESVGKV